MADPNSSMIPVQVGGQTIYFSKDTPESEVLAEVKMIEQQQQMGTAPVMPSSFQTPTPSPVNVAAGRALAPIPTSAAEMGGAVLGLMTLGTRGRPGVPMTMGQRISGQMVPAGFGAGVTRTGIETLRPFLTNEPPQYSSVAPAVIGGAALAAPTMGLARAGLVPGMGQLAREAVYQGAVGGAMGGAEELAKGQMPTLAGVAGPGVVGGALGALAGVPTVYGQQFMEAASKAITNINAFVNAGIKNVTPAMVNPARYGKEEAKRLSNGLFDSQGREVVNRRNSVYAQLSDGVTNSVGARPEGAALASTIRERVMTIPELEVARNKAIAAKDQAEVDLGRATEARSKAEAANFAVKTEESLKAHKLAITAEQKASERNFEATMQSLVEDARTMSLEALQQTGRGADAPVVRQSFVDRIVKPMKSAYDDYFTRGFDAVPNDVPGFDARPVIKEAKALRNELAQSKNVNAQEISKIDAVIADLEGTGRPVATREFGQFGMFSPVREVTTEPTYQGLTLKQFRDIRDALYKYGQVGEVVGPNKTQIKGLGHSISKQIEQQAERVYGTEIGSHLKGISADYRFYKDLTERDGFAALFSSDANSKAVKSLVDDVLEHGPGIESYANVVSFIENLAAPKQGMTVAKTEAGPVLMRGTTIIAPEMAAAMKGHLNGLIHANLLKRSEANGKINNTVLSGLFEKIGNHEGLPEMMGYSRGDIANFSAMLKDFPDVGRLTEQDMATYLTNPYFRKLAESRGTGLSSIIRMDMAERAVQERMNQATLMESAGKVAEARRLYDSAQAIAAKNGIDAAAADAKYKAALNTPGLRVFAPGIKGSPEGQINAESYRTILKTLFDPAAGATSNKYVENIFTYLRSSRDPADKQLLKDLQASYVNDYLSLFQTEARGGMLGEVPSARKFAEYFSPLPGAPAAAEMQRAQIVLDPAQFDAMQKLFKAGEQLRKYELALPEPSGRKADGKIGREQRTLFGEATKIFYRGIEGVADAMRRGDYNSALAGLMDPDKYANRLYANGEWITLGGRAAGFAPTRAYMEAQNRGQQPSIPPYLQRFIPQPTR
jgi:hypothetical protein